ncbi:MAG: class I SAM-dependent methyltransferase [Paracoccaceae bacterium]|jgi:cyclopropane fatty-acyl-phospholipid synthase-like methyltransferase|nr:class I SAM-dependent methyltransferase [Paracoccaceae bacterium]
MVDVKAHWDNVWQTKPAESTSWYQANSSRSLGYIDRVKLDKSMPVIDIGSGASRLIDGFLDLEFTDITALDISASAFAHSKKRLGAAANRVSFIEADILRWQPKRRYQLWHDRAVFHFLTEQRDIDSYVSTLKATLRTGGFFICGGFSTSGPQKCSGLPVQQYDATMMAVTFGRWLDFVESEVETHLTPAGVEQHFLWSFFRRK